MCVLRRACSARVLHSGLVVSDECCRLPSFVCGPSCENVQMSAGHVHKEPENASCTGPSGDRSWDCLD